MPDHSHCQDHSALTYYSRILKTDEGSCMSMDLNTTRALFTTCCCVARPMPSYYPASEFER